jgi:chromate transporter
MIGHDILERLVDNPSVHTFLDGVTAGVVGLISATAIGILSDTLTDIHAWIIFSLALIVLFTSKSKWIVAAIILASGLYGLLFL